MRRLLLTLAVVFTSCELLYAQSGPYSSIFDDGLYEQHGDIVAGVAIYGGMITYSDNYVNYEVGFFVNGVLRGYGTLDPEYDDYPIIDGMGIYFNPDELDGNIVTFKLYDNTNNIEYNYCIPSETIIEGHDYVDYDNPRILDFGRSYTKDITGYGDGNDKWYLISSPLYTNVDLEAPENLANAPFVTNMVSDNLEIFDLYFFDQEGTGNGKEWKNWKKDVDGGSTNWGFDLAPGKGYLYANRQNVTLTFVGEPYNSDGKIHLARGTNSDHSYLVGWNLIGNPYPVSATIGRNYYIMNDTGTGLIAENSISAPIEAMEGIFVYAEADGEIVAFTPQANNTKRSMEEDRVALNLNRNNGGAIDRVIVRFDEGGTLPKYTLRENSTIIYIPQADRDYAVVKGSATNVIPVNFKTEDFGVYTLSSDIAGANVDYMHLIDKITGEDVDMLLEGEYSFVAAPVDRQDRFILRLNYSGYFDDNDVNNFAYQNGSDIVVCGEGTLQVFDVMGRFVSSYEINGVQTIHALPMGVYIFRMLGDDVKTQKIYVR